MLRVALAIGSKESEAAFETRIITAANLLVDNSNAMKHNAYTGLQYGRLNHIFELADVLC
jgi:hypothetical protein